MTRVVWAAVGGALLLATAGCGAHHFGPDSRNVNLSHTVGVDGEVAAAIDPANPLTLLAGAISANFQTMDAFSSADGGTHWSSKRIEPLALDACFADPAVGVASDGREYYAYLRQQCATANSTRVVVRTRKSPTSRWSAARLVAPLPAALGEDRPAMVVDTGSASKNPGRVWIAWANYSNEHWRGAFIAHSDDTGAHWSDPVSVEDGGLEPSLAVARDGTLVEASVDAADKSIVISSPRRFHREIDATKSFYRWCSRRQLLPAMPHRHVCATPSIAIDQRRSVAYVTWSGVTARGTRGVFVRSFALSQLEKGPLTKALPKPLDTRAEGEEDEFFPTAAVDQATGAVWVCFYETQGRPRRLARFVCDVSDDGARAWRRVTAATKPSDETGQFAPPFGYGDYESVVAAGGYAHPFWTAIGGFELNDDVFTTTLAKP